MPEPDMKLMHETLVALRNDVKAMRQEMQEGFGDVKMRLNTLEEHYAGMLHHLGDIVGADARQNRELDGLRKRLDRIEKRLEIVD
jgi:regulator of replication initiation timing